MTDRPDDGLSTVTPVGNLCETASTPAYQSDAHLLNVIEAFLLSRQVGNCTSRTLGFYRDTLERFARFPGPRFAATRF